MTKVGIRFAEVLPHNHRFETVLSARQLYTSHAVDRFIANHGDGHPEVIALRQALGRTGVKYVRSQGSAKI